MAFIVPEQFRDNSYDGMPNTNEGDLFGAFRIPYRSGGRIIGGAIFMICSASEGSLNMPWERVSVTLVNYSGKLLGRAPTWEELCWVQRYFWESKDAAILFIRPGDNPKTLTIQMWRHQNWNSLNMTLPDIMEDKFIGPTIKEAMYGL